MSRTIRELSLRTRELSLRTRELSLRTRELSLRTLELSLSRRTGSGDRSGVLRTAPRRPACALAAGPCFSAVSAAASAAMLACWAAALACRPIQRLAVSVVDNLSVADRVVASAPVLGWGFSADAAPSTDGDAAVGADGADRAPAWAPPGAAARADPLGARTVTTVLVRVASRNSPMAANSMMMMPETSGLIWGRMGARARTTAATHTA